eukprot:gene18841-20737_t
MELTSFNQDLNALLSGNSSVENLISRLIDFQTAYKNVFSFENVKSDELKQSIDIFIQIMTENSCLGLGEDKSSLMKAKKESLGCLRIVSRSKDCASILAQNEGYALGILSMANVSSNAQSGGETDLILEALRVISNCLFHNQRFRQIFMKEECTKYVTDLLSKSLESEFLEKEATLLEVKILFLISALEHGVRAKMVTEYGTLDVLVKILEVSLRKKGLIQNEGIGAMPEEKKIKNQESHLFAEMDIKLFSEILKTLFNISVDACEDCTKDYTSSDTYKKLMVVLHCFLTHLSTTVDHFNELLGHIAHMIINIPTCCLDGLTPNAKRRGWNERIPKRDGYPIEYELKDMSAIVTLILALDNELKSNKKQQEGCNIVFSILATLSRVCRYMRFVRKYLRDQILPPIKDATVRPELIDSLKGRLVKLMTTVDTNTKTVCADFLFVLCKENVDRLVKHTGYGNAAGLLASRGLMDKSSATKTGDYSSEDSDSETEEYNAVADEIDLMTGAVSGRTEGDDPMKDMTDEEKQANAEELMGLIDRLAALNVVKPMKIGEDGCPQEVSNEEVKAFVKHKIDSQD